MSPPAQALLLHPPPDVINRRSRHFGGRAEIHGCTTAVGPGMTSSSCAEGRPGPGSATTPVMSSLWWNRFAARKLVWSTPIDATPASLAGSWTRGVPYSTTARITVPHPTPSMTATDATSCWSSPTSRQACLRARSVSELRGRMSVLVSLHVVTSHAHSWQRQSRWSQTSATGRPAEGRSQIVVRRRPRGDPAAQAPDLSRDRLDDLLELAEGPRHTEQDEPVEPEHGPASTTVMFHLGPAFFRVLDTTDLEAPGPASGPGRTTCRSRPTTLH